ncbi:unnamed protein product, partial [Bubo scandiacus]
RSCQRLLFSSLNNPSSFSLSSQDSCSSPQIISMVYSRPSLTGPCLSCGRDPRAGC